MQEFIQKANYLGKNKTPFFFLIDFEQKKPLIFSLEENKKSPVKFIFQNNLNSLSNSPKKFNLEKTPIPFHNYKFSFNQVKKEIQKGNTYLLNLSFPTEIKTNYSLEEIFKYSQAKYKCYYPDEFVCFSPEPFINIKNNKIYSYPMKGTINSEIKNSKNILLNSEKEFNEHNTIVDLIRNDLALVSKNIQVKKYRYLEKIKKHNGYIYQTSSEICGILDKNWNNNIGTILAKLLPAGSISGAPKIKTVEIIKYIEHEERGYYTGIFGYFDGESLDSAVAIRYIEKKGEKLFFRSGGGITFASNINDEYDEILEKIYVPISTF